MEDLEEKYSLLMGFLLPRVHKCIESIDPIKLVERGPFLEPHIHINIKDGCQVITNTILLKFSQKFYFLYKGRNNE